MMGLMATSLVIDVGCAMACVMVPLVQGPWTLEDMRLNI